MIQLLTENDSSGYPEEVNTALINMLANDVKELNQKIEKLKAEKDIQNAKFKNLQ